jgi:hypothetical protein
MKKTIIILIFAFMAVCLQSQTKPSFKGFFKPVDQNMFYQSYSATINGVVTDIIPDHIWTPRPYVGVSALELTPTSETGKVFNVTGFNSIGFGLSFEHLINNNGTPYNDFAINGIIFLDDIPNQTSAINVKPTITVTGWQFVNLGGGYNIGLKKAFVLIGLSYTFNK